MCGGGCLEGRPQPNLVAILITQDVILAIFLACLPTIFGVSARGPDEVWSPAFLQFILLVKKERKCKESEDRKKDSSEPTFAIEEREVLNPGR